MRTPPARAATILVLGILSCGAPDPPRWSSRRAVGPSAGAPSWCEALDGALRSLDARLECLDIPGFVTTGTFGPRESLRETSFDACFSAPADLRAIQRPEERAGTLGFSYDFDASFGSHAGLDLGQLASWLPSSSLRAASGTSARITVRLGDAAWLPISNLAPTIRARLDGLARGSEPWRQLDHCRRLLCREDTYFASTALVARPEVSIRSRDRRSFAGHVGWRPVGFDVDSSRAERGEITLAASQPLVIAYRPEPSRGPLQRGDACCGYLGEECCGDGSCHAGYTCASGHCDACGARGERCCAPGEGACRDGLACVDGTCGPCGGAHEPCCVAGGASCREALGCEEGTCLPARRIRRIRAEGRSTTESSGGEPRRFDVVARCPPRYPHLQECTGWLAGGNTEGRDPFTMQDGDRARRQQTADACVCVAEHEGSSMLSLEGHWIWCVVTAVCADR